MNLLAKRGFTLVELVIVIAVLALLAGIAVVGYGSVQANARDAKIKSGAQKIAEAVELWTLENRSQPSSQSSGLSGGFALSGEATEPCTQTGWVANQQNNCAIEAALVDDGLLTSDYIASLPDNPNFDEPGRTYRLEPCSALPNHYVLYYSLENPSAQDRASYDVVAIDKCGNGESARDTYNMQGALLLDLTVI